MREIKFRSWDGEKMMFFDLTYGLDCGLIYKGDESMDIWDGVIVMQFTGLSDKHDKEIYEGDIVSVEWGGMEDEYVIRELGNPFVIEFRDYGWFPFDKYLPTPECIKVIGNIHENPELK